MNDIEHETALAALREHASQLPNGRWYFSSSPGYHRDEENAVAVVHACLILGVPITDILSSTTWLLVIQHLVSLDKRVQELELRR